MQKTPREEFFRVKLQVIEQAAAALEGSDAARRKQGETELYKLRTSAEPYELCFYILDRSSVDAAQFAAVGAIREACLREWQTVASKSDHIRDKLLLFVANRSPSMKPFVRLQALHAVAVIVKRGFFRGGDGTGQKVCDAMMGQVEHFMRRGAEQQAVGASYALAVISEFSIHNPSSTSLGQPPEFHFRVHKLFQKHTLPRILLLLLKLVAALLPALTQMAAAPVAANEGMRHKTIGLLCTVLESLCVILSWDFSLEGDTSTGLAHRRDGAAEGEAESFQPPLSPAWAALLVAPSGKDPRQSPSVRLCSMLFLLLPLVDPAAAPAAASSTAARSLREALGRLATLSGPLPRGCPQAMPALAARLWQGFAKCLGNSLKQLEQLRQQGQGGQSRLQLVEVQCEWAMHSCSAIFNGAAMGPALGASVPDRRVLLHTAASWAAVLMKGMGSTAGGNAAAAKVVAEAAASALQLSAAAGRAACGEAGGAGSQSTAAAHARQGAAHLLQLYLNLVERGKDGAGEEAEGLLAGAAAVGRLATVHSLRATAASLAKLGGQVVAKDSWPARFARLDKLVRLCYLLVSVPSDSPLPIVFCSEAEDEEEELRQLLAAKRGGQVRVESGGSSDSLMWKLLPQVQAATAGGKSGLPAAVARESFGCLVRAFRVLGPFLAALATPTRRSSLNDAFIAAGLEAVDSLAQGFRLWAAMLLLPRKPCVAPNSVGGREAATQIFSFVGSVLSLKRSLVPSNSQATQHLSTHTETTKIVAQSSSLILKCSSLLSDMLSSASFRKLLSSNPPSNMDSLQTIASSFLSPPKWQPSSPSAVVPHLLDEALAFRLGEFFAICITSQLNMNKSEAAARAKGQFESMQKLIRSRIHKMQQELREDGPADVDSLVIILAVSRGLVAATYYEKSLRQASRNFLLTVATTLMEILGKFATSKREPTSPRAVLSPAGAKVYRLFCCRVGAPRGKGLRAVLRFVSLIVGYTCKDLPEQGAVQFVRNCRSFTSGVLQMQARRRAEVYKLSTFVRKAEEAESALEFQALFDMLGNMVCYGTNVTHNPSLVATVVDSIMSSLCEIAPRLSASLIGTSAVCSGFFALMQGLMYFCPERLLSPQGHSVVHVLVNALAGCIPMISLPDVQREALQTCGILAKLVFSNLHGGNGNVEHGRQVLPIALPVLPSLLRLLVELPLGKEQVEPAADALFPLLVADAAFQSSQAFFAYAKSLVVRQQSKIQEDSLKVEMQRRTLESFKRLLSAQGLGAAIGISEQTTSGERSISFRGNVRFFLTSMRCVLTQK